MASQQQNIKDADTKTLRQQIHDIPMLKKGEDAQLGRAWRDYRDIDARNKLVSAHLRFAMSQIRQYKATGLSQQDMLQIASEGLLKAAKKYDPDKKEGTETRFATYAAHWIKAGIYEQSITQRSAVKMGTTSSYKAIFFNLSKAMQVIQQRHRVMDISQYEDKHWQALTDEINNGDRKHEVNVAEVKHMAERLNLGDASLSAPVNDDGATMSFQDTIVDDAPQAAEIYEENDEADMRRGILLEAFGRLNDREKDIIMQRRLSDEAVILETLGEQYGVSKERIRQIEVRGMEKLRTAFRNIASDKFGAASPMVKQLEWAMEHDPKFKL